MITIKCYSCQQEFQVTGEGEFSCPHCGHANRYSPTGKFVSQWERDWKSRPFAAFFETAKEALIHPVTFFRSHQSGKQFLPVIIYAIVAQTVGYLATFLYQTVFAWIQPAFFGVLLQSIRLEDVIGGIATPFFFGVFLLFMPVLAFIGIVFSTALNHFILWILKGTRHGIEATLHAVCFSMTANVCLIIPIFGGIIAGVWQLVLLIIGLKELHDIPYWKSVLTVLIPIAFCCCLAGVLVFFGIGAAILIPAFLKEAQTVIEVMPWIMPLVVT